MKTKNPMPAVWFFSVAVSAVVFGGISLFIYGFIPPQEGQSMAAKSMRIAKDPKAKTSQKSSHQEKRFDGPTINKTPYRKPAPKKLNHLWSYVGSYGPKNWGSIHNNFKLCSHGKNQSPIDLSDWKKPNMTTPLEFHYKKSLVNIYNSGHSLRSNAEKGSFILVHGKRYSLDHFEFHAPSEHTIDGKHFPMEMQFMHNDSHGNLAAVSVLIEEGSVNKLFAGFWQNLPSTYDKSRHTATINPSKLLPKKRVYHSYIGSLTKPPCSEGVQWHVLSEPIKLSFDQIESFRKVIGYNARPVQPLYSRQSYLHQQ